jgi:hypothetical protein
LPRRGQEAAGLEWVAATFGAAGGCGRLRFGQGRQVTPRLWKIPERLPPARSDEKTIRGLGNSQTFATVASRLQAAPTRTIFHTSVVPERKVMLRQNPNIETRNKFEYQMTK